MEMQHLSFPELKFQDLTLQVCLDCLCSNGVPPSIWWIVVVCMDGWMDGWEPKMTTLFGRRFLFVSKNHWVHRWLEVLFLEVIHCHPKTKQMLCLEETLLQGVMCHFVLIRVPFACLFLKQSPLTAIRSSMIPTFQS